MKYIVSLALLISTCFNVYSVDRYASPTGLAGNSGTSTNSPWDLTSALVQLRTLGAGTTLYLMDGSYTNGPYQLYHVHGVANGAAVTLKGLNLWKAYIEQSSGDGISLGFDPGTDYCTNIVVDGLVIRSNALGGLHMDAPYPVVRNCIITENGWSGVYLSSSSCKYGLLENSWVGLNARLHTNGQSHGAYVSGEGLIIRNNVFYNPRSGYNLHCYTGYTNVWQNGIKLYQNITFGATNMYGVVLTGANGNDDSNPGTNMLCNNSIYDGVQLYNGAWEITNNIIYKGIHTLPIETYHPPVWVHADYNMYPQAITNYPGAHDVINASPGFVDVATGRLWITSSSAARNAAASSICLAINFFGDNQSSVVDIGAVQYNSILEGDSRNFIPIGTNSYWTNMVGNISAVALSGNATVTFKSIKVGTSGVEWGLTAAYGSTSTNASPVVNHTVNVSGLPAGQTIHYRIHTTDSSGFDLYSGDGTFTTSSDYILRGVL